MTLKMVDGDWTGIMHYKDWNDLHRFAIQTETDENHERILNILGKSDWGQKALRTPDNHGRLPIHLAALAGNVATVKILHKLALETIGAVDCNGDTPLNIALKMSGPGRRMYLQSICQEEEGEKK